MKQVSLIALIGALVMGGCARTALHRPSVPVYTPSEKQMLIEEAHAALQEYTEAKAGENLSPEASLGLRALRITVLLAIARVRDAGMERQAEDLRGTLESVATTQYGYESRIPDAVRDHEVIDPVLVPAAITPVVYAKTP